MLLVLLIFYILFYYTTSTGLTLHNIHIATETKTKTTTDIINKRITLSTRVVRNTIKYNTHIHTHRYIHYGNA